MTLGTLIRCTGMLIQRVLAPNPGPMTLTGTNTYLVGDGAGNLAVVDPGPDEPPSHLTAILDAARPLGTITTVLVTHRHGDHLPAAIPLCERTGARLVGHADLPGVQRALGDDEVCFGPLRALETPGHTRELFVLGPDRFATPFSRATWSRALARLSSTISQAPSRSTWPPSSGCWRWRRRRSIPGTGHSSTMASASCASTSAIVGSDCNRCSTSWPRRGPSTVDELVGAHLYGLRPHQLDPAGDSQRARQP